MKKVDAILIMVIVTIGLLVPIAIITAHKQQEKIELIGENGTWSMSEIHLKLNQDNVITMVSRDVEHSFTVDALNISVVLYPGHTVTVNIHPTESGNFEFKCTLFCSPNHPTMKGVLIVE